MITQKLIDKAAGGDQAALTDLYESTYSSVYNKVRFMIKDEDAVLDIMQDTYIKAFESLGQLEDSSKFEPWVKRIAQNKSIDYLRKSKPLAFSDMVPDDSDEVLEFEDDRSENLPEEVIDRRETARLVSEILDSLPDDQRACISMYYYDQLSVKEIASELGIPEATVKSRMQYGRKKIEVKVRDLEKKGTKLYGMAPLPFFLLLFRKAGQNTSEPSASVLESILSGTSKGIDAAYTAGAASAKSAAGAAGKAIGQAAAGTVGKAAVSAAGKALVLKILAAAVAVAVVGAGIAAIVNNTKQQSPEPVPAEESQKNEAANVASEEPTKAPEEQQTAENTSENTVPSGTDDKKPEQKEESISDEACAKAYQDILEEYRICMSQGPTGNSPLLNIEKVRKTTETRDGSRAIEYALYDIDHNGVKELIMVYCEFTESGSGTKETYIPFDLYTFDGNAAINLFKDINLDYINLHIGDNGICWVAFLDENGNEMTDYYEFFGVIRKGSDGRMRFVDSEYFSLDEASGSRYYKHYVSPGETEESFLSDPVPVQEFRDIWLPKDVKLNYHSILKNIYNGD